LRRIVDFYLHTAHAGDRLLNPQRDGIDVGPPAADCQPVRLTNGVAALDWFAAEHLCVLAAQRRAMTRGWYGRVWRLSRALDSFHYQRGHFRSHLASCLAGLAAADALADPACQTRAHRHLGNAYKIMGDPGEAGHHLANALAIAERIDDSRATAHALCIRAWQGDHQQGLADSTRALGLYRQLGDPVREGRALRMMGWFYSRLGQYPQARDACQRAIEMARGHPDRIGEGHALEVLGYVAHHSGDHAQALAIYHQVLALNHDLGNRRSDVTTLTYLGEVYLSIGRPTDARRVWQQAVAQCREQHRTAEGEELQRLLDTVVPRQRAS
jgi:tetratricopeptide (TPR) repeat protein